MLRHRTVLVSAIIASALVGSASSAAASHGGGGGGGGTPPPATAQLTITPKIALGGTGTGTLTLGSAAIAPTTVTLSDDYFNSPAVATLPPSVTVPAGQRSASFAIQGGNYPNRTFLVTVSTSLSGVRATFYRTPLTTTDIIAITNASISRNGDLKFTATSDTPSATLSASFNETPVPLVNKGRGVWEGRGTVPVAGGDIVVSSNLLGCSAKSPFTPTPSHFC